MEEIILFLYVLIYTYIWFCWQSLLYKEELAGPNHIMEDIGANINSKFYLKFLSLERYKKKVAETS